MLNFDESRLFHGLALASPTSRRFAWRAPTVGISRAQAPPDCRMSKGGKSKVVRRFSAMFSLFP
jgi:hypothetical protein